MSILLLTQPAMIAIKYNVAVFRIDSYAARKGASVRIANEGDVSVVSLLKS